ncbi:MAG: SMC family ATPase [Candidatus Micrarchaeota archaeon]
MIKSVRLICWRSHADTLLEFREGTNLLVGIMGAGKSSVMEAISFSFFGTFPALERRKLKLENIIRLNEPKAQVVLEFVWENATYRIERAIERSKKGVSTSAEIFRNGTLVEHGPVAVSAYIASITGMDYDLFTRAVYSEQNSIDYFLTLDPRRRKEEMDALLGLDRFESARANAITVINRIRSKRQGLEGQFSREKLRGLEDEEKRRLGEKEAAEASLKKAREALDRHSREAAAALASYENMRKVREKHDILSKDAIRLQAQSEALFRALEGKSVDSATEASINSRLKALLEERSGLAELQKETESRLSSLSKESGSLEARLRQSLDSKTKLASATEELKTLLGGASKESLASLQKEAEQSALSLDSELKSIEREIAELNDSLSKLRPGLSSCPLCSSKLTDDNISHVKAEKERLFAEKRTRLEALSRQIPKAKRQSEEQLQRIRKISLINEKAEALRKDASGADDISGRKKITEAELEKASQARKELQSKAEPLSASIEKLRIEGNELKSLFAKKAEAQDVSQKLKETAEAVAKLNFDEKSFEALRIAAERSGIESERAQSARKEAELQLKMAVDMLTQIRSGLESMRGMDQAINELSALEEQLSIFKNALLDAQVSMRHNLADAINAAMNEVWPVFYPYRNYRALRLGVSEKDYIFELDDGGGEWKALETIASGGERACAALALRVALAIVLTPKLGWLILDEPTHNLDSTAVELLSSALELKVPQIVRQTFVITHDEAFMGSEFASSYRLSRDKNNNGESRLEIT